MGVCSGKTEELPRERVVLSQSATQRPSGFSRLLRQYLLLRLQILFLATAFYPSVAQVNESWERRIDGPVNGDDSGLRVKVASYGSIYVAGWQTGSGSVYNRDWVIAKYTRSGATTWIRFYDGPVNYDDKAFDLALDDRGDVYVAGSQYTSWVPGNGYDARVAKYTSRGDLVWSDVYDGPAGGDITIDDHGFSIAVDGGGTTFTAGVQNYGYTVSVADYLLLHHDVDGNQLWSRSYNGAGDSLDVANKVAVDPFGNVIVTGYSSGAEEGLNAVTLKYSSTGELRWLRSYNGIACGNDVPEAIAVGSSGEVVIAGWSTNPTGNTDVLTIKYSSAGDTLWQRRYNGPANADDRGYGVVLDESGNVLVAGSSIGIGTGYDFTVIKYSPHGSELWVRRFDGPAHVHDVPIALVSDKKNNLYVTGSSDGDSSGLDILTVKLSPFGDSLWAIRFNGAANGDDSASSVDVDSYGNVYVSGTSVGKGSNDDIVLIKYVQCGEDYDNDGVPNCLDNCLTMSNPDQNDSNNDGIGDICDFLGGDVNGSGMVSVSDVVYLINYIFAGGAAPSPLSAGDANCNGAISISDAVYLINYIFAGGAAPCEG